MGTDAPAGLLLTGGRSRRMGRDKANLPWRAASEGRAVAEDGAGTALTWAERAGSLLAAIAEPALEVGPGRSGLPVAPEPEPGGGPLLAVVAGWRSLRGLGSPGPVIVLACDLPLLDPGVLSVLAGRSGDASTVPLVGGRPQWCCACYSARALDAATALTEAGRRDLAALAEAGRIDYVGGDLLGASLATIADADTPAEVSALGLLLDVVQQ